ncbi:hypothetical protein FS749_015328 [Ceratobasidium sp. UAMH 11750]|nr:hypothetical protein FS749_015328 [Ceratobasidium sp. UAMH 11750]
MVAILPIVLGALASLYATLLNPAGPLYLQDLATVAVSGIGSASVTVYVFQTLVGRRPHASLRTLLSMDTPFQYLNHLFRPIPGVRSLDLYRPDTKALMVFGPTVSLQVCLDSEVSYRHRSDLRSVDVFGRGKSVLTTMGRMVLVRSYPLPVTLACSGSDAVCALVVYRRDMKALVVYSRTRSFWVCYIIVCTLATACVLVIGILVRRNLAAANVSSNTVRAPTQPVYWLAENAQDEEPGCWLLVPLPINTTYNGYERDNGPDDDVSEMCASDSQGVNTVASETATDITVTSFGTPHSDSGSNLTTTLPVDPASVPLPCAEDDDFELGGDATRPTTDPCPSDSEDPANVPLPPDDGIWDVDAELELATYSGRQNNSLLSTDIGSNDSLADEVGTGESSGLGSLSMSEDQSAEFGGAPRFLVEDGTGGASVSASTSLDSNILGELGNAAQEGPAGDARNDNGADGTLDTSVSMSIDNTGTGASTSLDTPRPNTLPIEAAGTSEFPTEDSLDLNLIIESRSQLLDVDLKDLRNSGSELVPDVDWDEEKMVVAKPNAPTGTAGPSGDPLEDSVDLDLANATRTRLLGVDLKELEGAASGFVLDDNGEANDLASKSTGTVSIFELQTRSSLDLGLDIGAQTQLMDVTLKELEKYADDSVDEGSRRHGPQTGSLEPEPPTEDSLELKLDMDAGSQLVDTTFSSLEDLFPDADTSESDHQFGLQFNKPAHLAPPVSSGFDRSFPRVSAFPNLPTIAEESFGSLADISPDTTAWELGMPRTQATPAPAEDSLDLTLEITGSPLLDVGFGELGDISDDFGESVMTGFMGRVGSLETNTPADTSADSILDTTGEVQESC